MAFTPVFKKTGLSAISEDAFRLAIEGVNGITANGYWKMDVLVDIARNQEAVGIDSTQLLDKALKELDVIPETPDYDDYYDLCQQVMGYEELAKVQAELGYIGAAKVTLSRLENFERDDYDVKDMIAEVLASIASSEVRRGLSEEEIRNLSPEIVRLVLLDNNEVVHKALEYFGFQGKLAS